MKKLLLLFVIFVSLSNSKSFAQTDTFLGEIKMFGGNFAPRGWEFCHGQLLPISQNTALFSLLGCQYGGDCRTTFALPDLRGRAPIGTGRGPGLSEVRWAEQGGRESVTLIQANLPNHTHTATAQTTVTTNVLTSSDDATHTIPEEGDVPAVSNFGPGLSTTKVKTYGPATNTVQGQVLSSGTTVTVLPTGGSQAFNNRTPYLGINYIIATVGVFPSRR